MADRQDDGILLNFFPDPPPFYKHFTTDNQNRLEEIQKEATAGGDASTSASTSANTSPANTSPGPKLSAEQILTLPTELRYLVPPEPPADDEDFEVFGESTRAKGNSRFQQNMDFVSAKLNNEMILPGWKYEQLYPAADEPSTEPAPASASSNFDRQNYLFRFNRSIILTYIELLGIVALDPTSEHKDAKLKHILTMVTNMHALINEYRPHQARETLINIMQEQVERKKREIEGVQKMKERVRDVLEGFEKEVDAWNGSVDSDNTEHHGSEAEDKRRTVQREMWNAMDEILGQ
jgi:mediator of RNA polymerase II transcription subunit 7